MKMEARSDKPAIYDLTAVPEEDAPEPSVGVEECAPEASSDVEQVYDGSDEDKTVRPDCSAGDEVASLRRNDSMATLDAEPYETAAPDSSNQSCASSAPQAPSLACDAVRARMAYMTDEAVGAFLASQDALPCAETIVRAAARDHRMHVAGNSVAHSWLEDTVLIFSFRGTVSSWDVLEDIEVLRVRPAWAPSTARVHAGFLAHYKKLSRHIRRRVYEALAAGIKDAYFTGHSLGAAVASLAFYETLACGLSLKLVTFAGPQFGDEAFVHWASRAALAAGASVTTVENIHDAVPRLPIFLAKSWFNVSHLISVRGRTTNPLEAHHIDSYLELCRAI